MSASSLDPPDLKAAPKANPLQPIEPAVDAQTIAQFGGAPVVDFRPHDHGISLRLGHLDQLHTEFFGQQGAGGFDETQVGDVVHDGPTIGIEEHHLHFGLDARGVFDHQKAFGLNSKSEARNPKQIRIGKIRMEGRQSGHTLCFGFRHSEFRSRGGPDRAGTGTRDKSFRARNT